MNKKELGLILARRMNINTGRSKAFDKRTV